MYPLPQKVNIPVRVHFNYVPETNIQIVVNEPTERFFFQITGMNRFNEVAGFEDPFDEETIPAQYVSPTILLERMIKRKEERADARSKRIEAKLINRASKKMALLFRSINT